MNRREPDDELRATIFMVANPHPAAVALYDRTDDGKAQACPSLVAAAGGIQASKTLEDALAFACGNWREERRQRTSR